jgi:hypothetical protein
MKLFLAKKKPQRKKKQIPASQKNRKIHPPLNFSFLRRKKTLMKRKKNFYKGV